MNHRDPFFDEWEKDFGISGKTVRRFSYAALLVWGGGILVSLIFWAVVIWGIIKLVNHYA